MANAKTITINLKAISDFSDVQSNVSQIQKMLGQLKLGPELTQKSGQIFSNLEKEAIKFQKFLDSGFKSKGDVIGLEASGKRIEQLFGQLQGIIGKIDPTILQQSFQIDPSKIDELCPHRVATLRPQ